MAVVPSAPSVHPRGYPPQLSSTSYALWWSLWATQQQFDRCRGWRLESATWTPMGRIAWSISDTNACVNLPRWQSFKCVSSHHSWDNEVLSSQLHWERATGNSLPVLSCTLPSMPLSFADLGLFPFSVINCNHECNSFAKSLSPSSESLNLTVSGIF